jgi:glycerate 2-kinase
MKVLVALDKFKGSLTAHQACATVAAELAGIHPDWRVKQCPLTDGGDGFARILTTAVGGRLESVEVANARGDRVPAEIGMVEIDRIPSSARRRLDDIKTKVETDASYAGQRLAVVEMASASGLMLLKPEERDVWRTHTFGTGELLARARDDRSVKGVVVGLGGSATHDLGFGALAALGIRFMDTNGAALTDLSPSNWDRIAAISHEYLRPMPPVWLACDVANPLLGPEGAAAVYARQKGLRTEDIPRLEAMTARAGRLLCAAFGRDFDTLSHIPGGGAAGGIAFGMQAAGLARLVPGYDLVSDWLGLEENLLAADMVITGEGCFDKSSLSGKGPGALVLAALNAKKSVHVFAGRVEADLLDNHMAVHEITPRHVSLAEALNGAEARLRSTVRTAFSARAQACSAMS